MVASILGSLLAGFSGGAGAMIYSSLGVQFQFLFIDGRFEVQ